MHKAPRFVRVGGGSFIIRSLPPTFCRKTVSTTRTHDLPVTKEQPYRCYQSSPSKGNRRCTRLHALRGLGEGNLSYVAFPLHFCKKVVLVTRTRDLPITKEQPYCCYQGSPSKGNPRHTRLPALRGLREGRLSYVTFPLLFCKKIVFMTQTRDLPVTKEQPYRCDQGLPSGPEAITKKKR